MELDTEDKLTDVYNLSNSNRCKELEAFAISYAHAQRDSSNTMQLIEVCVTLGWENCVGTSIVALIKIANNSILGMRNVNFPMILSTENELLIKNKETCWVCKGKFVEGSGDTSVLDYDHLSILILSGQVTFVDWHINLFFKR